MNSNAEKPRLFVLFSRFPYPLEKGDKLRGYYQLRALSNDFNIHLVCLTDVPISPENKKRIQLFCTTLHIFKLRKGTIFFRLFLQLFTNKPFQVAYFFSPSIRHKINVLLQEIKPNHIYCQLIRTSEYIKDYHYCSKTIDYMDALSIGMERRAQLAKNWRRYLLSEEAKRLRVYERSIFDYFEHHTIISSQDRSFISHPKNSKITVIPNGIDVSFFEEMEIEATHDLIFIGNLSYPPNVEAANFLIKKIMPCIPTKNLLLAGATPDSSLVKLAQRFEKITLLGWTEDIRKTYLKGRIFIAPMQIGTGMQNKILEAMALGIPCITTSLVNNAIQGKHGVDLLVADTLEEMLNSINNLENNSSLRENLIRNARSFVKQHYSWESGISELKKSLIT